MKVGELFVELGVQGADKAVKGLTDIKKGLSSIVSESLFAFAEVSGLVAAFAALNNASGNVGQSLQKFANLTGISTDYLQRLQYVFRQSGVGGDEVIGMLEKLQGAMASIQLMDEPPKWLDYIGAQVDIDPKKFQDTIYMFGKLRDYALHSMDSIQVRAQILRQSGLFSDNQIQALMTNKGDLSAVPTGQIRSAKEIEALNNSKVVWENFYAYLGRIRDSFVEKHSGAILRDLYKLADLFRTQILPAVEPAVHAFEQFAEKVIDFAEHHPEVTSFFTKMGIAVTALNAALGPLVGVLGALGTMLGGLGSLFSGLSAFLPILGAGAGIGAADLFSKWTKGTAFDKAFSDLTLSLSQKLGLIPQTASASTGAIHVTQNITTSDPVKAGSVAADKIKDIRHEQRRDYQKAMRAVPTINEPY